MKFMKNLFAPIESGLCKLTLDGGIAIRSNGDYKTYDAKSGSFINCDNFVFDMGEEEMFFVVPTNNVKEGDIILAAGKPKYVMGAEKNRLTVVNYENGAVETIIPERHIFMGNAYLYGMIVSPFGKMFGIGGEGGADNMMKFMMMNQMMKGFGGGKGFGGDMNPFMMMMFMKNMDGGMFGNMFDGIFDTGVKEKEIPDKKE